MSEIIELRGQKNRWRLSSLGARLTGWQILDGDAWRTLCRACEQCPPSQDNYRGAVLLPWAGRIGGESWSLDGCDVPVDRSADNPLLHGLHGLVADREWDVLERGPGRAVFACDIEPSEFYPRSLHSRVIYEFAQTDGGEALDVSIRCRNPERNGGPAYVIAGLHPYFMNPFGGPVDEMELRLAAEREFVLDRVLVPTGATEVSGERDFRRSRAIGSTSLDHPFRLNPEEREAASLRLRHFRLSIFPRAHCEYLVVFIPTHRQEIALEPQSGAPGAYRHPDFGLTRLAPGESFEYGVRFLARCD